MPRTRSDLGVDDTLPCWTTKYVGAHELRLRDGIFGCYTSTVYLYIWRWEPGRWTQKQYTRLPILTGPAWRIGAYEGVLANVSFYKVSYVFRLDAFGSQQSVACTSCSGA